MSFVSVLCMKSTYSTGALTSSSHIVFDNSTEHLSRQAVLWNCFQLSGRPSRIHDNTTSDTLDDLFTTSDRSQLSIERVFIDEGRAWCRLRNGSAFNTFLLSIVLRLKIADNPSGTICFVELKRLYQRETI